MQLTTCCLLLQVAKKASTLVCQKLIYQLFCVNLAHIFICKWKYKCIHTYICIYILLNTYLKSDIYGIYGIHGACVCL